MAGDRSVDPRGVDRYTREVEGVSPTDERTRRILDAAVHLAEAGGFAAVRLRDVAQTSGVALGTVYKRFRSKEALLVGVLSAEVHDLRARLATTPISGATPLARVIGYFEFLSDYLCDRPNFARAVIRSAASGEPAMGERLAEFHRVLFELGFQTMCGRAPRGPHEAEARMLTALQQVWFASLCGWAGAAFPKSGVVEFVADAAKLMTYGVDRLPVDE